MCSFHESSGIACWSASCVDRARRLQHLSRFAFHRHYLSTVMTRDQVVREFYRLINQRPPQVDAAEQLIDDYLLRGDRPRWCRLMETIWFLREHGF